MAGKYRKKLVFIEATQWFFPGDHEAVRIDTQGRPYIETPGGRLYVTPGDWIVKGPKDEFDLCKPDVFEQTYDPFEEALELKPIFEHFADLNDARDFRNVCGGYLLFGTDSYVVCDEERAKEFLALRGCTSEESSKLIQKMIQYGCDESLTVIDQK
jgi:hypothetical protein